MKIFTNKAALVAATLTAGQLVETKGGLVAGDNLGGQYLIAISGTGLTLANGNVAVPMNHGIVRAALFGVVGDYATDDTAAIDTVLGYAAPLGLTVDFEDLICRYTGTLDLPAGVSIRGNGAARIATFPQFGGDKSKLKPGIKDTISGAAIIFDGTGTTTTFTTVRSDVYASFVPMVSYKHLDNYNIDGVAFIQDMDVFDSGGTLTTDVNDNRATVYTAGFVDQSTLSAHKFTTIFGYFDVGGLIIYNEDGGTDPSGDPLVDPDYLDHVGCLISSGVHIIGHDTAAGAASQGLTGSKWTSCGIYGADHHTRLDGIYTVPALYIDGFLVSSGQIRGHSFANCNFRTYANESLKFDHCSDIQFVNSVWEFPSLAGGDSNSDASGGFVGTANTGDFVVVGGAGTSDPNLLTFLTQIGGNYQVIGAGAFGHAIFGTGTDFVRIRGTGSGDSIIQLSSDISSTTSDWQILRDSSDSDEFELRYDGTSKFRIGTDGVVKSELQAGSAFGLAVGSNQTIASGVITKPSDGNFFPVFTEGGAGTDDLDTINGASFAGEMIVIRAGLASTDVVCKDGGGNLRLAGDFTLTHSQDRIMLMWDGAAWIELSRSDNTA